MKKILIIYASAGDGHKTAAEAVYHAFSDLKRDDLKVIIIDSLNYTNRLFKYLYKVGYLLLIKYIPTLWSFLYHILDNRFFYLLVRPFRRFTNAFNTTRLVDFLVEERFNAAISTHFLGTEVISHLKNKGSLPLPLINVITDFKPHYFWQTKAIDYYVVAADSTKEELSDRGVYPDKIRVFGIPIDKKFNKFIPKNEARKKLKIYPDKFTILVMGGGFGVGPIEEVVLGLQQVDIDCQVIVVCGHNERLFSRLELLKKDFKKPTAIFGFCRNMDEIMAASDLMVSKVGGITTAEALARTLPIIVINPIPGQEARNAAFLFENDIGLKVKNAGEIKGVVEGLCHSSEIMRRLKDNMQQLAKPQACGDIIGLVFKAMR